MTRHRPAEASSRRRVRYQVACSLDGYIAAPDGGYDWIPMDPEIDFDALFAEFDTLLMGRKTYEALPAGYPGMKIVVFSRTLRQADHPEVTIVADGIRERLNALRREPGKDIWLFGGGELFRSLLELDCVDTVELAVVPVLLGRGRRFLPDPASRRRLSLTGERVYPQSGIVALEYRIERGVEAQ